MPDRQISRTVLLTLPHLVLSRKEGEWIEFTVAGETFYLSIKEIRCGRVVLSIHAEESVGAWRVMLVDFPIPESPVKGQ